MYRKYLDRHNDAVEMSHHGITLVFTPGIHGRPEVMYLRDIEVHCPACGKEQLQRYYSLVAWHTHSVRRMRTLLEEAPDIFSSQCTQCEEALRGEHAVRWMVHYGFPGLRGLVQGFAEKSGWRRWLCSPFAHIDGQLVPEWTPLEDQANHEADVLTETLCMQAFERAFSCKEVARASLLANRTALNTAPTKLADGLWVVAADEAEAAIELVVAQGQNIDDLIAEPLATDGVARTGFFGAPGGWLGDIAPQLPTNLFGVASTDGVRDAMERVMRSWPIGTELVDGDDGLLRLKIPSTDDPARWPQLDEAGVASEAARTLSPPGEVAHLELDRILHFLTGLLDEEWADAPTETA